MSSKTINLNETLYNYILKTSLREHPAQKLLRDKTKELAASNMQISPEQGQFMALLVKLIGAKKTIEVGVFTGYSALSVALALPEDGEVIACDVSEEWTSIGKEFWKQANVAHKIKLHLAPAENTLNTLISAGNINTFDFAFIDADKTNYETYYEKLLELMRPNGLIAIDNVLWDGKVADNSVTDEDTRAIRALNTKLLTDDRVDISLVPIGDGVTLIRKK